jgi:hypothetical protein
MNEIRYILSVTDPNTAGCEVEVEIYYHDITQTQGVLLKSFSLVPPPDGLVYTPVADYLDSLLKHELPSLIGPEIQPINDQVKTYYIRFRQITKADPNPDWQTDIAFKRTVILGGVEQSKFKRNNFFVSYLQSSKAFLTWQPSGRFVHPDEKQYLTVLLTSPADFNVKITTWFTDSTSNIKLLPYTSAGNVLFRIKTGAKELGLDNIAPTKQIHFYTVEVINTNNNTTIAAPYRYYIEYRPLYNFYDIAFFNSLGGLDTIRVKGQVDWKIQTTSDDVEHVIYKDTYNTEKPRSQFSQSNTLKRDNYSGDAGWRRTKEEQESLVEILVSKGRYEIIDGRWIGLINLKSTLDLRSNADKTWSYPIEWSYGYTDKVFTPKLTVLGPGTGNSICSNLPTPQNIQFETIVDSQGGPEKYQATWTYDVPYTFGIIELSISTDSGITWQPISSALYTLNSQSPIDHLLKVVVRCPLDLSYYTQAIGAYGAPVNLCVPVTIPTPNMPDGTFNVPYAYAINLSGTPPFTLSGKIHPSWMAIEINGSQVTFSGTPDVQGQDITISFTANNCSGSSAVFSDTINIYKIPTLHQISNTENANSTRTQVFQVGENVSAGNKFDLVVYSHVVRVVAVNGDTPQTIAQKLADAINATTAAQWNEFNSAPANGTPGFKPTATANNNQVTIVLNFANQFAGSAQV